MLALSSRIYTVIFLSSLALAGCSAIQRAEVKQMEAMLLEAGFRVRPAETPAQVAHLQTLTPRKLMQRQQDGNTYYVYADPDVCNCLYVGDQGDYENLEQESMRRELRFEEVEFNDDAAMEWGLWGPYGPGY